MSRTLTVEVRPDDVGERLDRFLTGRIGEVSRSRVSALLNAGAIVDEAGLTLEPSLRVRAGQRFVVRLPPPVPAAPQAETLPLDVVFEDQHLLVLDKPAGLVVHPAPGHASGTLVNGLLGHCAGSLSGIGGVARPGIVHRLDKDVSGLMVVAKHDRAHVGLAGQFAVHNVERVYEAIVLGTPMAREGLLDAPIGRHPRQRKRMAVVASGKPAKTRYRVIEVADRAAAWLRLELLTGRTHQIRVHLQSIGLGIVGDPLYRPPRLPALPEHARARLAKVGRIALDARTLGFEHPLTGERLRFDRPPPPLFGSLFGLFRESAER